METWREITGYPKYKVSNMGNVIGVRGSALKPFDRKGNGYLTVFLFRKNATIHSLVMQEFVGPRPEGMVIHHKNGIKWDNRLENLEYCTQSYNIQQDFIDGRRSYKGERNNSVKLTEKEVLEIVKLYKTGSYTYATLAKKYGIALTGVSNIFNGHCWSYLTGIVCKHKTKV
jgi:hypothetical protein